MHPYVWSNISDIFLYCPADSHRERRNGVESPERMSECGVNGIKMQVSTSSKFLPWVAEVIS